MKLVYIVSLVCITIGYAQQNQPIQQNKTFNLSSDVPLDPSVKTGTLKNGMKYYLKKNSKPSNKAELRLVVDAGSILETPDQLGLAHFVEHMAFNGTKSFKKNELIDYLQSIGVAFGADLNAHTSFDETVYKLTVPTSDEKVYETSLHILKDWADGITFKEEEIDKERGVVAEELRARSNAQSRLYDNTIAAMTNNSRYADRLPIGNADIIKNSDYSSVINFYNDWYRPDLMALVIVGDIDIKKTEKRIKSLFSKMKSPENPKKRTRFGIPDNIEPAIKVATDKEARNVNLSIYYKQDKKEITTLQQYKEDLLRLLFSGMMKQRLEEIELQENTPLLSSTAGIGTFLADKDAYFLRAVLKEDKIKEGIDLLFLENEKVKRYGFTESELERYKKFLINHATLFKKETGKIPSKYYVEELIDTFTDNEPMPSESFRYDFYKEILPTISLEDLNQVGRNWIVDNNITVILKAPEKESIAIPTEKEIQLSITNANAAEVTPYIDSLADKKIQVSIDTPGTITETSYNEKIDVTTWKLSNGITVLAKPTTLQNDLISLSAFRPGGSSLAPDSLYISARNASNIIGNSGVDNISAIDLEKLNMGRTVSVSPYINFYEELFSGSSTAEELERMLKMVHLYFTLPNKDQQVFQAAKERMIATAKNDSLSPGAMFDNNVSKVMTQDHLRGVSLTEEQIRENLNLEDAYNFYKQRFSSAEGFTFMFVGSFDLEVLKVFTEKYLGSLPSKTDIDINSKDIGLRRITGAHKKTFYMGTEDKATVDMRFTGILDYSKEKHESIKLLGDLLRIRLTEELRENMAGVYGVQASGYATDTPYSWYRLNVRFTCAPENKDALIKKVQDVINEIKENGASEKNVQKIKRTQINRKKDALKNNNYWTMQLKNSLIYNWNPEEILDINKEVKDLSPIYFKNAANTYFDSDNYVEFTLLPKDVK